MVLDSALMAGTIVSLMMDGVCCIWQQKEEVGRREAVRRDIRAEYWHQKLMDHEIHEQRRNATANEDDKGTYPYFPRVHHHSDLSMVTQEDRRRQLLLDKVNASHNSRNHEQARASSEPPMSMAVAIIPVSPQSSPKTGERLPPTENRRRAHSSPRVKPFYDIRQDKKLKTTFIGGIRRATSLVDSDSEDEDDVDIDSSFADISLL